MRQLARAASDLVVAVVAGARIRELAGAALVPEEIPVSKAKVLYADTWVDRPCRLPAPCWPRIMRANYHVYS
jgi:hypothetical protein